MRLEERGRGFVLGCKSEKAGEKATIQLSFSQSSDPAGREEKKGVPFPIKLNRKEGTNFFSSNEGRSAFVAENKKKRGRTRKNVYGQLPPSKFEQEETLSECRFSVDLSGGACAKKKAGRDLAEVTQAYSFISAERAASTQKGERN